MSSEVQKTILLVDDEPLIIQGVTIILEKYGYKVITADSGEKAVRTVETESGIDLILMDITLESDTDGIETATKILEKHDLPLIFLSSHTDREVVEKTEGITSYGYIVKNSGEMVIIASIKMAFNLFEARMKEKAKGEAQEKSEKKYRSLIENIPDVSWTTDYKGNTVFISSNIGKIYGYSPDEIYESGDRLWLGRIHPDDVEKVKAEFNTLLKDGTPLDIEYRIKRKDGKWIWLQDRSTGTYEKDGILYADGVFYDITERKQVEERINGLNLLKEDLIGSGSLVEKMKLITDGVVDIMNADFARIWLTKQGDICDSGCIHAKISEGPHACTNLGSCLHLVASSGRYTHINGETHCRVPFGRYKIGRVAVAEESGLLTNDLTHDPNIHNHDWTRELGLVSFAGYRLLSHDGSSAGVLALFSKQALSPADESLLRTIAGTTSAVIQVGKSEEALRESEELFALFMDHLPAIVFMKDAESRTLYVNKHMNDMLGAKEWIGKTVPELYPENVAETMMADDKKALSEGYQSIIETVPDKHGINHIYQTQKFRIERFGKPALLGGIALNITELKQTEEALQKALQENENLLNELKHRAKNSFAMIVGMINLAAKADVSNETKTVLSEANSRIMAVSEMYDLLFRTDSFTEVQLDKYLTKIASSVPDISGNIAFKEKCDPVTVPVKTAVPVGIIVAELITNSIKYAFPGNRSGEIFLLLKKAENGVSIEVRDDGIGLPEGLDISTVDSLGLKLVYSLADQIDGSFKIENKNGTWCVVEFPIEEFACA